GGQRRRLLTDGLRLRASESGAGGLVEGRRTAGEISMEQLWRISQTRPATSCLVAGGPAAWGKGDSQGQPGGSPAIRAADRREASGGLDPGIQAGGTGLVFGQRGVSAGITGRGGRAASGDPLWRGAARGAGGGRL